MILYCLNHICFSFIVSIQQLRNSLFECSFCKGTIHCICLYLWIYSIIICCQNILLLLFKLSLLIGAQLCERIARLIDCFNCSSVHNHHFPIPIRYHVWGCWSRAYSHHLWSLYGHLGVKSFKEKNQQRGNIQLFILGFCHLILFDLLCCSTWVWICKSNGGTMWVYVDLHYFLCLKQLIWNQYDKIMVSDLEHFLWREVHNPSDGSILHLHRDHLQRRLLQDDKYLWQQLEGELHRQRLYEQQGPHTGPEVWVHPDPLPCWHGPYLAGKAVAYSTIFTINFTVHYINFKPSTLN